MIEFALLFGLGFLTAAFLGFLVAPAVHRRIVSYTEHRMKATMPLSPQEVRAQKDMVRALYAAENAKTAQDLTREREKGVSLQLRHDTLAKEAARLAAENSDMQAQMNEMNVDAGDLRSRLRREEGHIGQLKVSLHAAEQASTAKDADIEALQKRLLKIAADTDNLKIDIATRETEIESLKFRAKSLREERDALQREASLLTTRAKDAEARLTQEEHNVLRLQDKLNREAAGSADKDSLIERRMQEIAKLKEKLKAANAEAREAARTLRAASAKPAPSLRQINGSPSALPAGEENVSDHDTPPSLAALPERPVEVEIAHLSDDARNRSTALSERLMNAGTPGHEQALREEIAAIGAEMVALTALQEGRTSPIYDLLPENADTSGERLSLAARAAKILSEQRG
ncbi:hypothetical protein [Rhizobium sp. BK251]|uniref:hypothetical protein n=1 Tax=Rhizobium sp. BK251 TaxID=2512125 RepID=UPI00104C303A|nr:hypothetical protein [Rhizobium sp. BK251]TCL65113.1 hypothetical protein EV286_1138 [Rhizobium sp. BK251]